MKLVLPIMIVLSAFFNVARADFYPPPQQRYTTCRVEFSGNYYYVSRNGQRFTDLTSSLQQAISQQMQLENSGTCDISYQSPGTCQLEFTGNYYYVSRNGSRLSELVSDYHSALSTRDQLYQSHNCDENTYRPNQVCKTEYTGNYYYVSRNGNRFSELVSDLNQVTNMRNDFARNYVCQIQYQQANCRLEFTGNYYYISINSQRSSELVSDLNQVLNQQRDFSQRGMCSPPIAEKCSVEFTGNYYYVARSGARISNLVSDFNQANSIMRDLYYSRNCF